MATSHKRLQVPVQRLRWRCSPASSAVRPSDRLAPGEVPVAQGRALAALELGLGLWAPGYNLFVAGPSGSGRRTVVSRLLERLSPPPVEPLDYAYVSNLERPEEPLLLTFPAGTGRRFRADLDELVRFLRAQYPRFLEDAELAREKRRLSDRRRRYEDKLRGRVMQEAAALGFRIAGPESGPFWLATPMPVVGDAALSMEELRRRTEEGGLSRQRLSAWERSASLLGDRITLFQQQARKRQQDADRQLRGHTLRRIRLAVLPQVHLLRERYPAPEARAFLDRVARDIEETWSDLFCHPDRRRMSANGNGHAEPREPPEEPPIGDYLAHLVLDREGQARPPVVHEDHPTHANLFGTIEPPRYDYDLPEPGRIHGGSLLQADGGYLVLSAPDVLQEEGVWPALKRTLLSGKLEIRGADPRGGGSSAALKPQPIPLRVKVILIGGYEHWQQLSDQDPDFAKAFKVLADFDQEMPRTPRGIGEYLGVVSSIVRRESLRPFDRGAMAAMAESGARMAGRADRLTARFSEVANLAREADFWAKKERAHRVARRHVERALERIGARHGLVGEKLQEMISEGFILLALEGRRVGQVNGLIIYGVGEHSFGVPCRITATAGPGEGLIANIERMANLSGPSHDKGVLILAGFLRQRWATDKPLCLAASICFEQSYTEVDGDSASLVEVVALISSLAGIPVRQDLAVTGSINQQGEIQPVGDINEKIEGFFDVCRQAGLSGSQGVIIPRRNVPDLMLRDDVVAAVRERRFTVYGAQHIDQVLELATGIPPGKRDRRGRFPPDSINGRVDRVLERYARIVRAQHNGHGAPAAD